MFTATTKTREKKNSTYTIGKLVFDKIKMYFVLSFFLLFFVLYFFFLFSLKQTQ